MVGSKALDVDRFVRQWRGVVVFLRFLCGVNLIPIENPCMVYINHKKIQPNADRYEVRPVQSVIGFTFCHGIPTMFQTIFSGKNARVTLRFLLHNCCCCGFLLPNYMVIIDIVMVSMGQQSICLPICLTFTVGICMGSEGRPRMVYIQT